jgi:hypothetical protein
MLSVLTLVMIGVLGWRISKGWPAGPKTYAFICLTVVVLIVTVIAWRRAPASDVAPSRTMM